MYTCASVLVQVSGRGFLARRPGRRKRIARIRMVGPFIMDVSRLGAGMTSTVPGTAMSPL